MQMALRFPTKIKALILSAAITGDFKHSLYDKIMSDEFKSATISSSMARIGAYLMKFDPKSAINETLEFDGKYDEKTRK